MQFLKDLTTRTKILCGYAFVAILTMFDHDCGLNLCEPDSAGQRHFR